MGGSFRNTSPQFNFNRSEAEFQSTQREESTLKSEPGNERKTLVRVDLEVGVALGVEQEVISKGCVLEKSFMVEDINASRRLPARPSLPLY
jgi:hypothetical protein